jgi:hypothetical protein
VQHEATTPTGAAILVATVDEFTAEIDFSITKTGYGIGQRDISEVPNVLRVYLSDTETAVTGPKSDLKEESATIIECNIDDMNPEFFEYISSKLFNAGVSDVFFSNLIMKKGRPGILLSVICENESAEVVKNIIFTESTTLGIRTFPFRKDTLVRKFETIPTLYGNLTVKRSYHNGTEVSCKPEYEECKQIAAAKGIPLKEVYNEVMAIITKRKE